MVSQNKQEVFRFLKGLDKSARIGVCGHARPDGDTVGSVLGLTAALKLSGFRESTPLLSDDKSKPETYSYLPRFDEFLSPSEVKSKGLTFDVLVVVDTPTLGRLATGSEFLNLAKIVVRIDHHRVGDLRSHYTWEDTSYAATSQMIWDLIKHADFVYDSATAEACLTGVFTDTGGFRFQNTNAAVYRAAAEMTEAGASSAKLANFIYFSKSKKALALEARVLSRLEIANEGRVALSYLTYADYNEIGATREDAEDLTDLVRSIKGPDIAVLINKSSQGIRASLRSKSDFNVAEVAAIFEGGGHRAAAGISIHDKSISIEAFRETILAVLPGASIEQ